MILKRPHSSERCTEHIEIGSRYDEGKRDVMIPGIFNRADVFNAKVQKVSECLSEMKTIKKVKVKYIDR